MIAIAAIILGAGLLVAGLFWLIMRQGRRRLKEWDSAWHRIREDQDRADAAAAEIRSAQD